jgi:hypothetical protein
MAMCCGIAGAQDHVSNFETCISEAKQKHADATMETYLSYKCDGSTAQRLAARPDQCAADVKPALRNIERRSRQLEDGLYLRMIWRTEVCAGMCETRFYNDARETSYLCEVRRHTAGRVAQDGGQTLRNTGYQRYVNDYQQDRRYGPAVRRYEQPYYSSRRRIPEIEAGYPVTERWYYVQPGWYREYRYPGDYADDRRDDYRRDDDVGDDYRRDDYRSDEYSRNDYRRGDYR